MFRIEPSKIQGTLAIPSSKSHTLRAIFFAALATGVSHIEAILLSPDTYVMIEAVRQLGAKVSIQGTSLTIQGFEGKPKVPDNVIDCGNSGIALRFIGALAGLIPHYTILTGDDSIRHNRPVKPLLNALNQLGAFAASSREDGTAPILVKGPFVHASASLDGADSQPVSGLLIAAAFAPHPIELHVVNPGEKPWIDLTLDWFQRLGIKFHRSGYTHYKTEGNTIIKGFDYRVPGDFSTAAYPIAAALITNSELTLTNLDMNDVQGDKAIIPLLEKMGASFHITHSSITIKKGAKLKGALIDANDFVDAVPILAVLGCFAEGRTEITNAAIARNKESDRIHAITYELRKMGAVIEEKPDGFIVEKSSLKGADLHTYADQRIVLSLSVAAMAATGPSAIHNVSTAAKTYPNFQSDFNSVGAKIEHDNLWI